MLIALTYAFSFQIRLQCVHLVMEYCQGGDLFNRIKSKGHYSEAEAALVVKQLASVLDSAHARGIMHRDLKPENILLVSKDSDTDICLADFGSAAFFRPGKFGTHYPVNIT